MLYNFADSLRARTNHAGDAVHVNGNLAPVSAATVAIALNVDEAQVVWYSVHADNEWIDYQVPAS